MEYNKTYESFMNYADECKDVIRRTYFDREAADNLNLDSNKLGIDEIVREHRLKMIDTKIEHTIRMIEQIVKVNESLGLRVDLDLVIKVAALYHDIGRIRQATWCNTFGDSIYKKMDRPFNNHGEEGYDIFINNDFNVDDRYIPIIGEIILHHQDYHTQSKLNYKFDSDLKDINIDNIITGNFQLNDAEWQIASLIVQLVADIDKMDILYQHLSSDFEMIRDYVSDRSMDKLDNISKKWGVSKNEILEYNKIEERNYQPQELRIPVKNMPIEKLELPSYMQHRFYNNSWPQLQQLVQEDDWNFITMLWWRLSHFLNEISFTATLVNIHESKLLEQIYERIPLRYKSLVEDAFEASQEVLVEDRIERNKGRVYLKR